jgi:hypothetical protein
VTDRRRHQRPHRPRAHRPSGNGRRVDKWGVVRLCNACSTDHAREWHRDPSGGSVCDQCWRRRFG